MISSLLICTALMNPGLPARNLSIALEPGIRQSITEYAYAGALQAAVGISRRTQFRGPGQKFYAPEESFLEQAQAHLQMSAEQRSSNYVALHEKLAESVRMRHVIGFHGIYSVRVAGTVRTIARDLKDFVELQQTISPEIAELFYLKLLTSHMPINTRLRITYLANGQVTQREVSFMGPFAGAKSSVVAPKFEFLPLSGGYGSRSPFNLEPSMILDIQKI